MEDNLQLNYQTIIDFLWYLLKLFTCLESRDAGNMQVVSLFELKMKRKDVCSKLTQYIHDWAITVADLINAGFL